MLRKVTIQQTRISIPQTGISAQETSVILHLAPTASVTVFQNPDRKARAPPREWLSQPATPLASDHCGLHREPLCTNGPRHTDVLTDTDTHTNSDTTGNTGKTTTWCEERPVATAMSETENCTAAHIMQEMTYGKQLSK